jgi:threonine/homoserine/homoserine lactone efflux protein
MSHRTAAWLAWSLVTLSVVLILGGDALSVATRSVVRGRPYGVKHFLPAGSTIWLRCSRSP